MDIRHKVHLVIYRVRERGLEIFVRDQGEKGIELPHAADQYDEHAFTLDTNEFISLDAVENEASERSQGVAIEGDYHDIPSLKGLLLSDAIKLRDHLREIPKAEDGSFVALKQLAERMLPEQYRMLKELRDILVDRNSTKYM